MTSNRDRDIGFQELNHHVKEEHDRGENGVVGNAHRPGSFRNGELRIDKVDENVKDERGKLVQEQFVVQTPQLQHQGSRVHWERFLNVRSIKVMLVENDDSTRHIVNALLCNCNYEVIEAANGLQAWKILKDLTIHVDIILTEVAMPLLSGVSLLCKIMSHNTRKNIPVIMMSSHDSMGLVFKCLSKGAVDFLVKPIRKNELKILWQHVWRRCHSSSGSGSESGTQTQKSVKLKSSVKSDRNSDSNDGDDDESNGLDIGDGSGDGSGTQSSWTKQAVEVDSPRAASQWDQKAECQDSTCGQVIWSNVEAPGARDIRGHEQLDNVAKGKELVIDELRHSRGGECSSHKYKAVGYNMSDPQKDDGEFEALREPANIEIKDNLSVDPNEGAVPELSLKRLREVKDTESAVQYDRNVLRHSELSAFSRYNTAANASSSPNEITRSSSQLDNKSDVTKKDSMRDIRSHSDGYVNQTSNRVGNNMDVGSATVKLHVNPLILKDKSEVTFAINCLHSSSAFRPIKTDIKSPSQQVRPTKTNDVKTIPNGILDPPRDPHHELPVQHIHHHHHVHHYHNIDGGDQSLSNPDDLSLKKLAADAQYCGSSNVLGGPVLEGIPGNYSLNRSASGSKYGSNGQNGSSTAVNAGGANMESVVGVAPENGNGDDSGSGSGNGIDQSKSAQREAALTKFRQKRKERCFQKKVRYQNRKKLAEQRPRVRGQFVKQTGNTDNSSSAADS